MPVGTPCRAAESGAGRDGALEVDLVDRKILRILQQDATLTVSEIGRAVGLSSTPCWKRIQKLEASGVIRKRVALLCADKVGLGVAVLVNIQTGDHSQAAIDAFITSIRAMPEVLGFHRLAGDVDFSLRVVTADIRQYEAFHRRLTGLMPLRRVSSYVELQELKSETALPLGFVAETEEPEDPREASGPTPNRRLGGRSEIGGAAREVCVNRATPMDAGQFPKALPRGTGAAKPYVEP